MNNNIVRLLLACVALAASGCAVGFEQQGRVIDASRVAEIEIGTSNKQDVLDRFGPPTTIARVDDDDIESSLAGSPQVTSRDEDDTLQEDVYTWEYVESSEDFFSVLLYTNWSRATHRDVLMVLFDENDRVKAFGFSKETDAQLEKEPEETAGEE